MAKVMRSAADIEAFALANVGAHPGDLATVVGEHFGISRQAVSRHLARLVADEKLVATGSTRSRRYALPVRQDVFTLPITPRLEEHRVWEERVAPLLRELPENVFDICFFGFTEMLNNAIEHSGGASVEILVERSAGRVKLFITDDGVGIFRKIADELHLDDERHAILELSKGKLTTARERHSGEGIFFTSKMFDRFTLSSGATHVACVDGESWLLDAHDVADIPDLGAGTVVHMTIDAGSSRTSKEVFDRYSAPVEEDYGFVRTRVPVALVRQGQENLISRSQAKRLLARVDRFKEVILDFAGVGMIGQAFADEVFRVFTAKHPDIHLSYLNAAPDVEKMIRRAQSTAGAPR